MTRAGVASSVWVARTVAALAPLVALFGGTADGLVPSPAIVVVVGLGGVLGAFRPDHLAVSVGLGVVLAWWATQLHHEMPAGCLVAAAGLTAAHVAGTLLGYGPPWMPIAPSLARVWVVRAVLVWLAAPVVWLVARAYADRDTPTSFWLAGLAAALVGAVVAAVAVTAPRGAESDR
jgi:hypothetical protein